jgi:Uma2 family endonuclease
MMPTRGPDVPYLLAPIDTVIPDGITNLESFRRWARSDEFPRHGHFAFYDGTLWADDSMEHAVSHNLVKTEVARVLANLMHAEDLGQYFGDGMLVTNDGAGLSNEPDGVFVSHGRFASGAASGAGGDGDDYVELVGAPDMVLEVVSRSSLKKDVNDLPRLYFRAGIPEYWLVDARGEVVQFTIYRAGAAGYEAAPADADGWVESQVFSRSFRITRGTNRAGDPKFTLEVR